MTCPVTHYFTSILPSESSDFSESLIQTYSHFLKPNFLFLTPIKVTEILQFSRHLNFLQFISVAITAGYCRIHYAWIPHNWALQEFHEFVIVVAWSCTLYKHVANVQSDRTKQPHKDSGILCLQPYSSGHSKDE